MFFRQAKYTYKISLNEAIRNRKNPRKSHFLSFLYLKKGTGYKFGDYLKLWSTDFLTMYKAFSGIQKTILLLL